MDYNLSYILATNGDNGVRVEYRGIDYIPSNIEWIDGVNSFDVVHNLPDADLYEAPDYARKLIDEEYAYYQRTIILPPNDSSFSLNVLVNGSEGTDTYTYEVYTSSLVCNKNGVSIEVTSKKNTSFEDKNSMIVIQSSQSTDKLTIALLQEYVHIQLTLKSYAFKGEGGYSGGNINDIQFSNMFHYLTNEDSVSNEVLTVDVSAIGITNNFVIRDITKFAYFDINSGNYTCSPVTGKYYETFQVWNNGRLETVNREVFYDEDTGGIYKQIPFQDDFKVVKNKESIVITNYGRCFLEDDAYYTITLANSDDLNNTCTVTITYEDYKLSNFSTSSSTSSYVVAENL